MTQLIVVEDCLSKANLVEVMAEIKQHKTEFELTDTKYAKFTRWEPLITSKLIRIVGAFLYNDRVKKLAFNYRDHCWRIFVSNSDTTYEVQVTKYLVDSRYDWHNDHIISPGYRARILNYILYLNDDFEGGELQISEELVSHYTQLDKDYPVSQTITPKKNMLLIMPAWTVHRVKPIIAGNRLTVNGHI